MSIEEKIHMQNLVFGKNFLKNDLNVQNGHM